MKTYTFSSCPFTVARLRKQVEVTGTLDSKAKFNHNITGELLLKKKLLNTFVLVLVVSHNFSLSTFSILKDIALASNLGV